MRRLSQRATIAYCISIKQSGMTACTPLYAYSPLSYLYTHSPRTPHVGAYHKTRLAYSPPRRRRAGLRAPQYNPHPRYFLPAYFRSLLDVPPRASRAERQFLTPACAHFVAISNKLFRRSLNLSAAAHYLCLALGRQLKPWDLKPRVGRGGGPTGRHSNGLAAMALPPAACCHAAS